MPAKPWKRKVAERHLLGLARRNGIRVHWLSGPKWHLRAIADSDKGRVSIPKPYSVKQYLVALHEFGHLLGSIPLTARTNVPFVGQESLNATPGAYHLLREMAAWAWAIEHIATELEVLVTPRHFDAALGHGIASHSWDVFTWPDVDD